MYYLRWVFRGDNSGFLWLNVFYLYLWGLQRRCGIGYFFVSSIRLFQAERGLSRGMKSRGMLVRLRRWQRRGDGGTVRSLGNGGVLLVSPWVLRGSRVLGYGVREIARPRILLRLRSLL